MKLLLTGVIAILATAGSAQGAAIRCDVYAALNRYHYAISLDTQTGALDVQTDDGFIARGSAVYTRSSRTGDEFFYLNTGFGQGVEIDIENGGRGRIAFCVTQNECYICTPRSP